MIHKKKWILLIQLMLLVMIGVTSCMNTETEEKKALREENQELKEQIEYNKENVENYFSALNEIEMNLLLIKEKEDLISAETSSGLELGSQQEDRINDYIKSIGELMDNNRTLINKLNRDISRSNVKLEEFEKSVERLNQTIEDREIEIQVLKSHLAEMNLRVDYLTARLDTLESEAERKSKVIQQQTQQLNEAFYAIGSRKELMENGIIEREGGFLGLGRSNKLRSDFNQEFFTRVDLSRDKKISIIGENPELVSVHPAESYEIIWEEDEQYLQITNPQKFWEAGRYLVIMIK